MPARAVREHRKSRLGCLVCKIRKIKCDETHPLCGNCAKRFPSSTQCRYPSAPSCQVRPQSHTATQINNIHDDHSGTTPSTPSRTIESRIWQHYLVNTAATLPPPYRQDLRAVWTEEVPAWAAEHEYLLDAALGLAAIHLYTLNGADKELSRTMLHAGYKYYANAASKYTKALAAEITPSNAGPILATALFIGFQSKIVPRLFAGDGHEQYSLPIDIFRLQRGISATYKLTAPFLAGQRLPEILSTSIIPTEKEVLPCADGRNLPPDVHHDALSLLLALSSAKDMTAADKDACKLAFAHVLNIHRCLDDEAQPELFFRRCVPEFFWLVPSRYVELLEQRSPIAMLILARYFAVSLVCEDLSWWVTGLAKREVLGIVSMMHFSWKELTEFPREMVADFTSDHDPGAETH